MSNIKDSRAAETNKADRFFYYMDIMNKKFGLILIISVAISSLAYAQIPSAPSSGGSGASSSLSVSRSTQHCYGSSRSGWRPGKIAGKIIRKIKAKRAQRRANRAQRRANRAQRKCWPSRSRVQKYPACGDIRSRAKGLQPGRVTPQAPTLADDDQALLEKLGKATAQLPEERSILKPKSMALPIRSMGDNLFVVLNPELVSMAEAKKIEIETIEIEGESKKVYKLGAIDQEKEAMQESLNQLLKKLGIEGELKIVKEQ